MTTSADEDVVLNLGLAQSFSVGAASISMADSISLLMENAVANEKDSGVIQNAAVTQCCVSIIATGIAKAAK